MINPSHKGIYGRSRGISRVSLLHALFVMHLLVVLVGVSTALCAHPDLKLLIGGLVLHIPTIMGKF